MQFLLGDQVKQAVCSLPISLDSNLQQANGEPESDLTSAVTWVISPKLGEEAKDIC